MALSHLNKAALSKASRTAIGQRMSQIKKNWKRSRWLTTSNAYRSDPIGRIDQDAPDNDKTRWTPNHPHLSEYIAASAVVHCFDGWSFLGRALEAELSGDPDAARHLGYYAELRAAMALLAGDGIGVFNSKHVIIDNAGQGACLRGAGTHAFTWDALQWWASNTAGVSTLQDAIRPGNLPLRDWLTHYPGGSSFVATSWLKQWGLDLSRLADDRDARNMASYRPTAFTSAGPTALADTLDVITKFWKICEPGANGGFPVLDRHLLRRGIQFVFDAKHSSATPRTAANYRSDTKYRNDIEAMLGSITPSGLSQDQWGRFLGYVDDPETPKVLVDASATSGPTHPNHSKQVLARATLLLRVATGSAANLLSSVASASRNELKFWWSGDSVRRRLWLENNPPIQFSDLWQDIDEASSSVAGWLQSAQHPCCHSLWKEQGAETATLATAERVALWGLQL